MFLQSYIGPVWSVPAILQTIDVHGPMNEDVPLVELCSLYLLACQVRVTVGDSGLCCCACVAYISSANVYECGAEQETCAFKK